jgi:hypothetical protein
MKILAAATAAMLIAQQLTSSAFAAGASDPGARTERLLRKLELLMAPQTHGPAAPVTATRTAAIRVGGVINRKSAFVGTVRCEVSLQHINNDAPTFYAETLGEPVTFSGNTGTCNVTLPFKWQFADINGVVFVVVSVFTDCACTGTEVTRESSFEFPIVAMPAEGTTRFLGFTIDM